MTANAGANVPNADRSSIVLGQGAIFLAALLMLFGLWSDDQYATALTGPLCVVFSLQCAWCFWSWHAVTGRWFDGYTVFFLSLCLFNGGHFLLETFGLNRDGVLMGAFSAETVNRTILLVNAGVSGFHLGGLLQGCRKPCPAPGRPAGTLRRDTDFSTYWAKVIGILFLFLSLPAVWSNLRTSIEIGLTSGYFSLYQRESLVGLANWQSVLTTFFVPGVLITLAMFRESRRWVAACWVLMFGYVVTNMVTGSRGAAMLLCAPLVVLHHQIVRRISPVYLLCGGLGIFILFPVIAQTRNLTIGDRRDALESALTDNLFVAAIHEMGGSAGTIAHTLELMPEQRPYDCGAGYTYASVTVCPNLFWERHLSVQWGRYADWLVWTVAPRSAERGGGLGFSVIAEAYANFSVFGPPLVMALLGFVVAAVVSWSRNVQLPFPAALEAVFLSAILVLPRSESATVLRPIVWFCVIPWILVKIHREPHAARRRNPPSATRGDIPLKRFGRPLREAAAAGNQR
jgi:oligosaccharide repeat unit polymerase